MIRSVDRAEGRWRGVPAGFQIAWRGEPAAQHLPGSPGALPLEVLRGIAALLWWKLRDVLAAPRRPREVIRRLPQAKPGLNR